MDDKYDVIVIGTGCGGAAAGALAAYYGHKTLILEKNDIAGGRAACYEKEGFKLDHGHVLMRCEKGPHGQLLRMIKCKDLMPEFSHAIDWGIKVIIDDITTDLPPFGSKILLPFFGLREFLKYRFKIKDCIDFLIFGFFVLFMQKKSIRKFDNKDAKSFFNKFFENKHLHTVFGGISTVALGSYTSKVSAGVFIRIMQSGIYDLIRIGYPVAKEGVSAIPKSFLRAAERYKAEIAFNTRVDKIIIEDNEVKGVIANGKTIEAKIVISNTGLDTTVFRLAGEEKFDSQYVEKIKKLKYSLGGFSLKYALNKPITKYPWGGEVPGNLDKITSDMMNGIIPERFPWMYLSPSILDPSLAPEGKQIISVLSGGSPEDPEKIDWKLWMEKVKQQVSEYFPDIDKHIIFCDESTPSDIAIFSERKYGDAVGVSQTIDQSGELRMPPVSPVKGLYYVGADVGKNHIGTELATESAIALAPYLKKAKK